MEPFIALHSVIATPRRITSIIVILSTGNVSQAANAHRPPLTTRNECRLKHPRGKPLRKPAEGRLDEISHEDKDGATTVPVSGRGPETDCKVLIRSSLASGYPFR